MYGVTELTSPSFYSFHVTTSSFFAPVNPNKKPAAFRIWISSLPSVIL